MKRNTFVLGLEDLEDVADMKDSEAGKLFKAILHYVAEGQTWKLPTRASVIFGFIRRRLDKDMVKYEAVCKKRSEAGKLGALKTNSLKAANADNR